MDSRSTSQLFTGSNASIAGCFPTVIGVLLGMVMPMLAAFIYPTYMHHMGDPFYEWTRLQELPFVFAECCVILWAGARGMNLRDYVQPLQKDIQIALGLFGIGLLASSIFVSKQPYTSIFISISMAVHMLFGLSLYYLAGSDQRQMMRILPHGLGLGLILLAFLTAWKFLLPPPASTVLGGVIEWPSALPGFINVRHFGSWTGAIAVLFAGLIIARKEQSRLDWRDWFYLLAIGMTIWSGTRAAVLAFSLACFIQIVGMRQWPSLHCLGRLAILTGFGAIFAWFLLPQAPEFGLFRSLEEYSSTSSAVSGRDELWAQTLDRWLDAPLFGWGSGSTFWEVYAGWPHTQPHNFVLQFLISWGLLGACGAFWLLGKAVYYAQRAVTHDAGALWPLLTCVYALLIMACFEGMLHYPRFIMLILALLAIILKMGYRKPA